MALWRPGDYLSAGGLNYLCDQVYSQLRCYIGQPKQLKHHLECPDILAHSGNIGVVAFSNI